MSHNNKKINEEKQDKRKITQRIAIKERLRLIKDSCAPTLTMRDIWSEVSPKYYEISYNTFLNTFKEDLDVSTLDIYTILAVAKYYKIPVHLLLSGADLSLEEFAVRAGLKQTQGFIPLDDYIGQYKGYMNSFNKDKTEISSFELEISVSDTGVPHAILIHHSEMITAGGELRSIDIEYRGTPILVLNNKTIYMTLTSDTGRFLILTFTYQKYLTGELYYRKGAVLTVESNQLEPVILNFVLFRYPVDLSENEIFLKGLLKITNETHQQYTVPLQSIEELCLHYPEVNAFIERFKATSVISEEPVYQIDEGMALYIADQDNPQRKSSVMKALLRLREQSTLPDRLIYPSYTPYSRLGKEIQNPDYDKNKTDTLQDSQSGKQNILYVYDTME